MLVTLLGVIIVMKPPFLLDLFGVGDRQGEGEARKTHFVIGYGIHPLHRVLDSVSNLNA